MPAPSSHSYCVDEAGDLTLFDREGRTIVGREGVSRCFVVGAALVPQPAGLTARLVALREQLTTDPYFAAIPSMRPESRKTAFLFHAKDDVAAVRREVFRVLRESDV